MSERTVDLRSDTLTLPTDSMRDAMATAPVGDDVYGEDPTVNRLQELAAARVGMQAALFVPSGTMGNTCALMAHARPGEEVLLESLAHIGLSECGNYAALAGLAVRTLDTECGVIAPDALSDIIRPPNVHYPQARLVCIENSHNNHAGAAWLPGQVEALALAARRHDIRLHMDGARVFNAAVAAGVDVRDYTRHVDSVMFCVSKGLSAPVGSLLCGSRAFIEQAHRMRKRLGGSMRQAGILAAAAIIAIEEMVDRLAEDHANAARLAAGLSQIDGVRPEVPSLPTNMVNVDVSALGWTSEQLVERWKARGIMCNPRPRSRARLVTCRHITASDVDSVVESTRAMVAAG